MEIVFFRIYVGVVNNNGNVITREDIESIEGTEVSNLNEIQTLLQIDDRFNVGIYKPFELTTDINDCDNDCNPFEDCWVGYVKLIK